MPCQCVTCNWCQQLDIRTNIFFDSPWLQELVNTKTLTWNVSIWAFQYGETFDPHQESSGRFLVWSVNPIWTQGPVRNHTDGYETFWAIGVEVRESNFEIGGISTNNFRSTGVTEFNWTSFWPRRLDLFLLVLTSYPGYLLSHRADSHLSPKSSCNQI